MVIEITLLKDSLIILKFYNPFIYYLFILFSKKNADCAHDFYKNKKIKYKICKVNPGQ